ncbi:MAG: methyltransferase [Pseudomonadales bacterium]
MQLILFILGSALLICISRKNILAMQSHGFFRFLAWECMLLLLLRQYPYWLVDRFSWYQCISWLLLFSAIPLVIGGALLLKQHGNSKDSARSDPALLGFEKTTQLVTQGLYRYIRHPMYGALLLLNGGLYFKQPFSSLNFVLAVSAAMLLVLTALREEQENLAYFGDAYRIYMTRSKRFLPGLW